MLEELRRLAEHARWADGVLIEALQAAHDVPAGIVREYAHVIGAAEIWLSRLQQRPSRLAVWPSLNLRETDDWQAAVHAGYAEYLATLDEAPLTRIVSYTNSAGRSLETPVKDILLHVALHGQYHRGKINLMLRQAGLPPAPTDYVAFVRGVPAATTADSRSR